MSLLRTFIALEIPSQLQDAIHQQTTGLRQSTDSAVRWVATQNLHLTLKFLGDVSSTNIPFLTQMLTQEAAQHPGFSLQIGGLGSFPNSRRARVIWIGIQAPAELEVLQRSIESAAARLGYSAEERPFSPHLTIGRVKQNLSAVDQQKLRAALEATHVGQIGRTNITAVHLFKSDLQPTGSIYTRLFSAPLKS